MHASKGKQQLGMGRRGAINYKKVLWEQRVPTKNEEQTKNRGIFQGEGGAIATASAQNHSPLPLYFLYLSISCHRYGHNEDKDPLNIDYK